MNMNSGKQSSRRIKEYEGAFIHRPSRSADFIGEKLETLKNSLSSIRLNLNVSSKKLENVPSIK
jgi:hypothetical protein